MNGQATSAGGGARLTLLTRMFWPDGFGGVERRTRCTADALTRAGVDVRVLTQTRDGAPARQDRLEPGYEVARFPAPAIGRQWRWRELVQARWWAGVVARHAGPGVLWATEPPAALGAILAGAADRLVYNPPWCAVGMRRVWRAWPEATTLRTRWLLRRVERSVFRRARWVVAASDNVADQLRHAHGDRPGLFVVPHGVELPPTDALDRVAARRRLRIEPDDFAVGVVARVDPLKDIPFLLRAVRFAGPGVGRVVIAGEGPDRPRVERVAAELGLADRLCWAGRLDDPLPAYAAMDAMVLPSIYEAFGNVVLEAMAAGVPVVGRRRCVDPRTPVLVANEELIEDGRTGALVDPRDPADLGRRLAELCGQRSRVQAMGRAAREAASSKSWDRMARQYMQCLGLPTGHREGERIAA